MRTSRILWSVPAILSMFLLTPPVRAQAPAPSGNAAPPKSWFQEITLNGFVSAGYSYNFNKPLSGQNTYRVFDVDDNTIKLDVAELVVQKAVSAPSEIGFRFDLTAGSSIPRVAAASGLFRDAETGKAQDFDLQQAFVSYIAPVGRGLRFDAGKFITHMGAEVIEGYDGYNDNYTRSILFGYAIPFTHTGLKVSMPFSDSFSAMVMVVNGWDNVKDNNKKKSFGGQLAITPSPKVALYVNYIGGAERNDDDVRHDIDFVAVLKPADPVALTLNVNYGTDQNAAGQGRNGRWFAASGALRVGLSESFALALRGEFFEDKEGVRTGAVQKLKSVTLTPEVKINKNLFVRWDLRHDFSDQKVFEKEGTPKDNQTTLAMNAGIVF